MYETIFPPSPNRHLSKIITTREDGSVAYGSQSGIFIFKCHQNSVTPLLIYDAHKEKVTSVIFSPNNIHEKIQNLIVSTSEDGFVKLWKVDTQSSEIGHNSHSVQNNTAKVVCGAWSQFSPKYIVSVADNDTIVLWDILGNITTKFFIPKLKPAVIEYSYHSDKVVAVGSKNGLVYVIKLHKKGEVIHRLRGHDKEVQALSWCPTFPSISINNKIIDQFFLASSSEEKEIFIWETVDGACEAKIQLPKSPFSKGKNHNYGKTDSDNFIPLFWASSDLIYSGTKFGELICYKIQLSLSSQSDNESDKDNDRCENSKDVDSWKLVHSHHSNALLALAGMPFKNKKENDNKMNIKIRQDSDSLECNNSEIKDLNMDNSSKSNHSNIGEKESGISSSESKRLIWTISKDQNLIAVHNDFNTYKLLFRFHTINGHAFEAAISPHDPNKIAFAVGDGKIRLWNASKSGCNVSVFWHKIKDRVYSLAWHPQKEGLLAYGTSEGRVGLLDIYTQKQPLNFNLIHNRTVYRLSWGPYYSDKDKDYSSGKKEFCLYSVGGGSIILHDPVKLKSENLIKVLIPCKKVTDLCWKYDYSVLVLGCAKGNLYLLRPPKLDLACAIYAFKKNIQSLVWHPIATTIDLDCSNFKGYFTYGSTDNESIIKVYNFVDKGDCNVEQVAALKGHTSYIQCVSWCPHIAGRLISASADFSIRIWDVTKHVQLFKYLASRSTLPLFCVWSPTDPDIIMTGYAQRAIISWRVSTASETIPILKDSIVKNRSNLRLSELIDTSGKETTDNEKNFKSDQLKEIDEDNLILATSVETKRKTKENKMFKKAWRSDMNPFEICYGLLKENSDKSMKFTLPFLDVENKFLDFLNLESDIQQKSNNWNEYYQIALWSGNLKDVIEEKVATGHLDDFLMSLVPCVSPRLWQESCLSYSKILSEKKNFRKAACYLLAIHKVYDAINLLSNEDYHLEAICIARCRLPESDPIFENIIRRYADWLTKTGNFYKASECFIYLNDMKEVANILSKKNHPEYLSLAAIAARKAGQLVLESEYASRALLLCLETLNWNLASQICDDHPDLKQLFFIYKTHTVIHNLDEEVLKLEKDLLTHLREEVGVETSYSDIYSSFSYVYDKNLLFTDKKKLYLSITMELSLASAAVEEELMLTHIIRAMNAASRYSKKGKEIHPLYKFSSWLSPEGYLMNQSIFCRTEESIKSKIVSLRAFLCQAIVEYLDSVLDESERNFTCDVKDAPNLLRGLINDGFNQDTFNYFQNQVKIKLIEKTIFHEYGKRNQNPASLSKSDSECKENDIEDLAESERKIGTDEEKEEIFEEIIAREREKMNRLKSYINNFENERVIAPNPAIIYCILRKLSHAFADKDNDLVDFVEKTWKDLESK